MELLRRYSNHSGLTKPLVSVLQETSQTTEEGHETVTNTDGQTAHPSWRAADRLTEADVANLIERYRAGATLSSLAKEHKISRGAVRRLLHREGVELRRRGLTAEQVDEAARLYALGWSLARLGERLGADPTTVWHRLRARGVRMRDMLGRKR